MRVLAVVALVMVVLLPPRRRHRRRRRRRLLPLSEVLYLQRIVPPRRCGGFGIIRRGRIRDANRQRRRLLGRQNGRPSLSLRRIVRVCRRLTSWRPSTFHIHNYGVQLRFIWSTNLSGNIAPRETPNLTGIQRLLEAANGKSLSVAVVATAKGYVATPNPRPHVQRIAKLPAASVLNGTGSYGWE